MIWQLSNTICWSRNLYGCVESKEVEHALHVDEGLSNVAVDRPEKIQGHRQLKQEAVHHHQVAHCHGTCEEEEKLSVKPYP